MKENQSDFRLLLFTITSSPYSCHHLVAALRARTGFLENPPAELHPNYAGFLHWLDNFFICPSFFHQPFGLAEFFL